MVSPNIVFWEVDTQKDFMLPGGNLYVPGAERLLPNIKRLTDAARQDRVFLVSHGCYHAEGRSRVLDLSSALRQRHPGAGFVPEALTGKVATVPNQPAAKLPVDLSQYQQILLEKQTLDIFASLHADELVKRFDPRTRVCRLWCGHGILRQLRRQGPARARAPGRGGSGRDRNPESQRWATNHFGTEGWWRPIH